MKNYISLFILLLFFPLNTYPFDSNNLKRIESKIDSLKQFINKIDNTTKVSSSYISDSILYNKMENISKDTYTKMNDGKDKLINGVMWLAGIILAFTTLFSIITGIYYFYLSKEKYKADILKFKNEVKSINEFQIKQIENELSTKINDLTTSFYYDYGMKFINENNYSIAFEFFDALYKTENYRRHVDVCYHLAECCYNLKENKKACKFLNEAYDATKDKIKKDAIRKTMIDYDCLEKSKNK